MATDKEDPTFDQRDQAVGHQYNAGTIFNIQNYPIKVRVIGVLLIFVGVVVGYSCVKYADNRAHLNAAAVKSTVAGLGEFSIKVSAVAKSYMNCESLYQSREFIFSKELSGCRDDVKIKLGMMQEVRDRYASLMNAESLNLMDELIRQTSRDYRDLSANVSETSLFEENFVRSFVLLCSKKKGSQNNEWDLSVNKGLTGAVNEISDVMAMQTAEYYTMRDFVVPRLYSMREIATSAARDTLGLDSVGASVQAISLYRKLSEDQGKYNPKKDDRPFQNGIMRRMQTRDFTSSTTSPETEGRERELEQARSQDAKMMLPFMALRGREGAAKQLVECGILKPNIFEDLRK